MKKFLILLSILLVLPIQSVEAAVTKADFSFNLLAQASKREPERTFRVKDYRVVDGDTADFILDRQQEPSIKARFLLFDAPEINKSVPYSQGAKKRVIELFSQADNIYVEYEGAEKDRYQRDLVHVWVDDVFLSEILVSEGYAIARYIEDYLPNSKYADIIYQSQDYARLNQNNVWLDGDSDYLAKAEGLPQEALPATTQTETPANPVANTRPAADNVYYQNCKAVRAAGAAPIRPGDPGWDPKFDGDNDGIGCE